MRQEEFGGRSHGRAGLLGFPAAVAAEDDGRFDLLRCNFVSGAKAVTSPRSSA